MTYLFSPWIWLALAGVPVLIHLINMLRHRRVKWAAMDFLLQSQRKHKKWIVFKQLLLLLLRMLAVAVIVMMLAQIRLQSDWGKIFGSPGVHHVVLLDDSYSMTDRRSDGTAFDRAKIAVKGLADQAARQGMSHTFSLVRFSTAANLNTDSRLDMIQENIDHEFRLRLESQLAALTPSQTAAGPAEAIDGVGRLPSKSDDENRIVYIVSDFRSRDWNEPTELRKSLEELQRAGTKIHLVHCVEAKRPNLAITALRPHVGTRAAGVEMFIEVEVTNFGDQVTGEVPIRLEEDGHTRPGLVIPNLAPGETVERRFRVNFPTAGEHTISAALENDTVPADNTRFAVLKLPDAVPVLIIDGSPRAQDGYFVASALAPGGKVRTGLLPQIERPQFLRRHDALAGFGAIYLLNVSRLDDAEIAALERYVADGGGVAFFPGEMSQARFYTDSFYRDGDGLFPVPLRFSTDLLVDRLEKAPDLVAGKHPLFDTFLTMRNNPLDDVRIERYFAVPEDWRPDPESTVRVIARLRNGAPLVVEQKFGQGRVVAVLTKASPEKIDSMAWNNWATNHSYLPALLNLQGYLAAARQADQEQIVGQPLIVDVEAARYEPQVRFLDPEQDLVDALVVDGENQDERLLASKNDTGKSGIYSALLRTGEGEEETRHFAYNVPAGEGDLDLLDGQQLDQQLTGLEYKFHLADDLRYDQEDLAGFPISDQLLYLLIGVLVIEQLMAYWASYHPSRKAVAAA